MSASIRHFFALVAFAGLCSFAAPAWAGDIKIEAKLVWGTNDEKSPNKDHKELSPDLADRLAKIFQWKHYFHVGAEEAVVKSDGYTKFKLSDKALVEIKALEGSKFEIKLYNQDKLITTRTEVIKKGKLGDITAIAGDVKGSDCAWFILIRQK